jgi:cytochrome c oxidase assembly factor CtaG
MTNLIRAWDWEPSIVIGCALVCAGYFWLERFRNLKRTICFLTGILLLLLNLVSPLDALADEYLLSAHTVQHFFLCLLIPPLLLLGIPDEFAKAVLRMRVAWPLRSAPFTWVMGVGVMLLWQVPILFDAALSNEPLHILQHVSLLAGGTLYWWPILSPAETARLPILSSISYLFTACLACSFLGAALTFGPSGIYSAYGPPEDSLHILSTLREQWGLDSATDQKLAGLIMWVPGCFVYLSAILAMLGRWYRAPEKQGELIA